MYTGKEVLAGWCVSVIMSVLIPMLGIAFMCGTVYATCKWIGSKF